MDRLCVFCGSSPGLRPAYSEAARRLGTLLAREGIALVYGGGHVGLMGQVADAVLEAGGHVIGVITEHLRDMELAHGALSDLRVVSSMHERKALMAELADGFIAMPGGFGTFEEFFEALTWSQLGLHKKPCGLLNIAGYYDKLIEFLRVCEAERFVAPSHSRLLLADTAPEALLRQLRAFSPEPIDKRAFLEATARQGRLLQ